MKKLGVASLLGVALGSLFQAHSADHRFGWMTGHWCSQTKGAVIQERWLPATDNLMLGVNRTVANNRTLAFEYLRIEVDEEQQAQFVAQPGGRQPIAFALADSGSDWARFENPDHDFPQGIEYRRQGDHLSARTSGPGKDGAEVEIAFEFEICEA